MGQGLWEGPELPCGAAVTAQPTRLETGTEVPTASGITSGVCLKMPEQV